MKQEDIKRYIKKSDKPGFGYMVIMEMPEFGAMRVEYLTKETFKKMYDDVLNTQKNTRDNLASIRKRLETINTEKNEELEKFIELANLAQGYHNGEKLKEEKTKAELDLTLIDRQIADMEKSMPELTRKTKSKK